MATTTGGDSSITYLSQKEAIKVDEELMGPLGFSVDQLMELAGLSVACSLADVYDKRNKILVFCGPGNNGGDGLVAARHLHHFGYDVSVCYPKQTDRQLYKNLVIQCKALKTIPFLDVPASLQYLSANQDRLIILDAIFGFSFKGAPRPPFNEVLEALRGMKNVPIVSVDIPSGWQVETGDEGEQGIQPEMLVRPRILLDDLYICYLFSGQSLH